MIDACQLYYEVQGPANGRTLLFLHGFMGSLHDWGETVHGLPQYRCILPDLAGHGRSVVCNAPDHWTMPGACALLIGLADDLGVRTWTPIGYSMGGRLALYLATRYPDRCDRLVIESASPGLPSRQEREQRQRWDEARASELESWDFSRFLTTWYSQPLFETLTRDRDRFLRILERRQRNDPLALARSMRGMGTGAQPSLCPDIADAAARGLGRAG
jgi:2-succinyl-6-hydroxy-2,4-cyclohexadiene-1-carboxylate synthase